MSPISIKLTVSLYLVLSGLSSGSLPGQEVLSLTRKPAIRIEFRIKAEEYRVCLKKILEDVETSQSRSLAEEAQKVKNLKFVTWTADKTPGAPVLSAVLDDRPAGYGRDIILTFKFKKELFPPEFEPVLYQSYESHFPGDPYHLKNVIDTKWKDLLQRPDFQRQIRAFLSAVPIANQISIRRRDLIIVPLSQDDLHAREGSELGVEFVSLEPPAGEPASLKLRTLGGRGWRGIPCMVTRFAFPLEKPYPPGWTDEIFLVFRHKRDETVQVFMLDYHWEFEAVADGLQTRPLG